MQSTSHHTSILPINLHTTSNSSKLLTNKAKYLSTTLDFLCNGNISDMNIIINHLQNSIPTTTTTTNASTPTPIQSTTTHSIQSSNTTPIPNITHHQQLSSVHIKQNINDEIINNIKSFIKKPSVRGRDNLIERQCKNIILTACTYSCADVNSKKTNFQLYWNF